jgi:hypothetical protein
MIVKLIEFGPNITNEIIGEEIYNKIKQEFSNEIIEIDFTGILVMTTFCAKQIFGRLLREYGENDFFKKLSFINASDTIKYVLNIGIN